MIAIISKQNSPRKPFLLRRSAAHFVLPSSPNGTAEVLNGASHQTQRREARPNPTSLLRIPEEANQSLQLTEEGDEWAHDQGTQWRHNPTVSKCDPPRLAYGLDTVKAAESDSRQMKKAGSDPQGPSNRLNSAGVTGHGELFRPDRSGNRSSGNRSSEYTKCADRDGSTTMKPTRQHTIPCIR